jgi:hypothetical protein
MIRGDAQLPRGGDHQPNSTLRPSNVEGSVPSQVDSTATEHTNPIPPRTATTQGGAYTEAAQPPRPASHGGGRTGPGRDLELPR